MDENPGPGTFLEPWVAIANPRQGEYEKELQAELRRESPLKGITCQAIAKRVDRDDVLFQTDLPKAAYTVVHLTWGPHPDPMRGMPFTVFFSSWEDFCNREMIPEYKDWLKWSEEA